MLEKEPKQGKKFQYLRIYNFEKNLVPSSPSVWSRIHLVPKIFGPEFTTWSRVHLVPNSPDTLFLCKCAILDDVFEEVVLLMLNL